MTSFFPDLNVWLALSFTKHSHSIDAWRWLNELSEDAVLLFSRYTQLGLLRLVTNPEVMGEHALTLQDGWLVYERWLGDRRIQFRPEPQRLDSAFREATERSPIKGRPGGSETVISNFRKRESGATLVTFDKALIGLARKQDYAAIIPG